MFLPQQRINQIHGAAISAGMDRHALFAGIDPQLSTGARSAGNQSAQLMADLDHLNRIEPVAGEVTPLVTWLSNALALVGPRRERGVFQEALGVLNERLSSMEGRGMPRSDPHETTAFGPASSPANAHFLDSGPPLDFSRPETQELLKILSENIWDAKEVRALLKAAGVNTSHVLMSQGPKPLWHDILERACAQGKLRRLLEVICADENHAEIATQIRLLLGPRPPVAAAPDKTGPLGEAGWKAARGGEERRTGHEDTLLDIAFLEQGVECARSVVRLLIYHGSSASHATGFVIAPDLILTNHHALFFQGRSADDVEVWFDYELDRHHAQKQYHVARCRRGKGAIVGDARHDWAVARLEEPTRVPALALTHGRSVREGDRVCIIQHPNGLPKKIGLVHNEVRYVDADVIQYLTDTDEGSSGSPVFNERWDVVALHHRWIDYGPGEVRDRVRNQGVRIKPIADALRDLGLLPELAIA